MTKKKIYIKPQLELMEIDHEISLVMATSPPGGDDFMSYEKDNSVQPPVQSNPPSYESDPFGGSSPDYSN